MPLPESSDPFEQHEQHVDLLEKVSLTSFTAQPTAILPFGYSVLSWAVVAPTGVQIKLNNLLVTKSGHQAVQLSVTTSYRLSAHAGQAYRTLGNVQVAVDRTSCETFEINNPKSAIEAPIKQAINNSPSVYFDPIIYDPFPLWVFFSPDLIHIRLALAARFDYIPDPHVRIAVSFGLYVHHAMIVPVRQSISVNINVNVLVQPFVAARINAAKENATNDMHEMIEGVCKVLTAFAVVPQGKQLSTVRVDAGNNGAGVVELTACTNELLRRFADVSRNVIIE
jgi:hypothetical protein